jgi:hypothetical protein
MRSACPSTARAPTQRHGAWREVPRLRASPVEGLEGCPLRSAAERPSWSVHSAGLGRRLAFWRPVESGVSCSWTEPALRWAGDAAWGLHGRAGVEPLDSPPRRVPGGQRAPSPSRTPAPLPRTCGRGRQLFDRLRPLQSCRRAQLRSRPRRGRDAEGRASRRKPCGAQSVPPRRVVATPRQPARDGAVPVLAPRRGRGRESPPRRGAGCWRRNYRLHSWSAHLAPPTWPCRLDAFGWAASPGGRARGCHGRDAQVEVDDVGGRGLAASRPQPDRAPRLSGERGDSPPPGRRDIHRSPASLTILTAVLT